MARGGVVGGLAGGVAGTGYAEGPPTERIPYALGGATAGAGIGAVMPAAAIPVMGAVKGISARFMPGSAQRQANTLLQDAFEKDEITGDLLESGLTVQRAVLLRMWAFPSQAGGAEPATWRCKSSHVTQPQPVTGTLKGCLKPVKLGKASESLML